MKKINNADVYLLVALAVLWNVWSLVSIAKFYLLNNLATYERVLFIIYLVVNITTYIYFIRHSQCEEKYPIPVITVDLKSLGVIIFLAWLLICFDVLNHSGEITHGFIKVILMVFSILFGWGFPIQIFDPDGFERWNRKLKWTDYTNF